MDGAEVLRKLRGFNLTSWNYIGHDPQQFRHYGPMAQDFDAAFGRDDRGAIGTPTTINSGDMAGILMVAAKELAVRSAGFETALKARDEKLSAQERRLAAQEQRLAELAARDREREARLAKLERLLDAAK